MSGTTSIGNGRWSVSLEAKLVSGEKLGLHPSDRGKSGTEKSLAVTFGHGE